MVRLIFISLFLFFFFSCAPKKENCSVPSYLRSENIPPNFSGNLYISTFSVPFKYLVLQNRMIFPLTYLGFISYEGTTLKVAKYKIDFFLPLWKVLKHRLVDKSCSIEPYKGGFLITSETDKGVKIYLRTDKRFKPLGAEICSLGSCYRVHYKHREVLIEKKFIDLVFVLNPSQ